MILSDALILPVPQLQTRQVMTSQIRSHRIFNTDLLYSCAYFIVKTGEKSSLNDGFNTIYWLYIIVAYFFGPPCIYI